MKLLLIASLALSLSAASFTAQAQHTVPRYSTSPTGNQTFANQKLGYSTSTDAVGTDTLNVYPSALRTHLALTVTDSVTVYASLGSAYIGDELIVTISNTAGSAHAVSFLGGRSIANPFEVSSSGNRIALTASKRAIIKFICDGVKWVETSRMVQ